MARTHALLRMTSRGTVTIPKEVRQGLGEDTLFEAVRREDGVIELRPRVLIDASQEWYWRERWQKMEREVQESYDRGDFRRHESGEELLAHLDQLADESKAERKD